jgi:hypothetical protein
MSITTRDRKLLWARAGGTCALCKSHLTAEAKGSDRDVVLGEEAHIVSEESKGPRFRPMSTKEVDAYDNLILLCPSEHKIVDEQVTYYTEERLQALKREHEQWVKDNVSPVIPPIKILNPEAGKSLMLQRIKTGKELMSILAHTYAAHHDHPEPQSSEKAALIGQFFQNTSDCIVIWDDIGSSGRIEAEFLMSKDISRLRDVGLVVYAAVRNHVVEGGVKAPAPWPVAYIVIYRGDDETSKTGTTDTKQRTD